MREKWKIGSRHSRYVKLDFTLSLSLPPSPSLSRSPSLHFSISLFLPLPLFYLSLSAVMIIVSIFLPSLQLAGQKNTPSPSPAISDNELESSSWIILAYLLGKVFLFLRFILRIVHLINILTLCQLCVVVFCGLCLPLCVCVSVYYILVCSITCCMTLLKVSKYWYTTRWRNLIRRCLGQHN